MSNKRGSKQSDRHIRNIKHNVSSLGNLRQTEKPYLILKHAHETAHAFLSAFDSVRKQRSGGRKGATTDEEQDLLRAMLVMTSSGLDSMIKQLIRDALPTLAEFDGRVREELTKYTARQLRGGDTDLSTPRVGDFLARILVAESQRMQIIKEFISSLTAGSLQSAQEIIRAANALGLSPDDIKLDSQELKPIFDVRNKIIHELDINFEAARRNRFPRAKSKMILYSNFLLEYAENVLHSVSAKISKHSKNN